MKRKMVIVQAALVVGLMMLAGSALAAPLSYFDAQIEDINTGKSVVAHNTEWADGTLFTALPDPTDPAGNWTQGGDGADGLWKQRGFENPDASTSPTVYESRGQYNGPNTEDLPILKTTINVPAVDQGTSHSVWALFWSDGSPWQLGASLWNQGLPGPVDGQAVLPLFNPYNNTGYVYRAYNAAEGSPGATYEVETNASITSDSGRHLWAAYLGDEVLGSTLSVYVDDGPPPADPGDGSMNLRTWYDGIGYGDPLGMEPLADGIIPEPASVLLLCIGLAGIGLLRRR